jgi:hypothetical protein
MHSVANVYIDWPAIAFTTNAQILPVTNPLMLQGGILSDPCIRLDGSFPV